jgi:hypothetical protein
VYGSKWLVACLMINIMLLSFHLLRRKSDDMKVFFGLKQMQKLLVDAKKFILMQKVKLIQKN